MENLLTSLLSLFLFISCIFCDPFLGALDSNSDSCTESRSCGNHTINFPFYIQGLQQPYCGHQGIQISCNNINNGPPSLNLSGDIYVVHEISYQNQSLLVSNTALSDPTTGSCTPPLRNLSLPSSDLVLASYQRKVFFLYGCPHNLTANGGFHYGTSEDVVAAPFIGDWNSAESIKDVLRRGFLLNWISVNCNPCERNSTTGDHPPQIQARSSYAKAGRPSHTVQV
ncbi:hypothetical protein TIFTF001_007847 [Ficus carica]|uniref:Wall-associated receptor kinase galacturonan-binding domain-containing protein n=1 Tax=Ficus carica TaxID=3494 RepID=A0AA87ZR08_FICCA|nr:hypothetical protein TIFTF001_007847 [Ficus carica]